MNALNNILKITILSSVLVGCATNIKEKIVRNSMLAASTGVVYGVTRDEFKTQHALMYGATAGLITAITSLYYHDPDKDIEDYKKKSKELAKSLDDFATPSSVTFNKGTSYVGSALNNPQSIPEKYRHLITPGQWTLKQIDEWEMIDENRKVHKTEMLELIPPKFNSN